jgi:alpha-L-rhamnosidase
MKKFIPLLIISLVFLSCLRADLSDLYPEDLKCNNLTNPSGTNTIPDFGWIVSSEARGKTQSAWQIILDKDPKNLEQDNTVLWNSGKVASDQNSWISYSGPSLEPAYKYFWKVRIWDEKDKPSVWSKSVSFITSLFDEKDWSGAQWIGYEETPDSMLLVPGIHKGIKIEGNIATKRSIVPYFRKEFTVKKKVKEAFVFISGLGQYELYMNGTRVGDRFLSPGWTNYLKTCFYNTFDVTGDLKKGPNAIGAIVGNGFYNINRERYYKLVITYGAPRLIIKMLIRYNDGTEDVIESNKTWKTTPSPFIFTSIFGGEDYDARLEQTGWNKSGFNDENWNAALPVRAPGGRLQPEIDYPLKVMQEFEPVNIYNPDSSIYVYDFGQNASGIIRLTVKGKKGQEVRLWPGELIGTDSLVAQRASGTPYYFSYTLKGEKEEVWIPRFTYYGFRYVRAEGAVPAGKPNPGDLPVINGLQLLHTRNSSPASGHFKCSNELFNSVYNLIGWAIKSNLASIATDCPHREKLGWLEQTHLMGNSIKYEYDIHNLFDKMIDDMVEAQLDNGLVPDIAPEYVQFAGGFRDSPEWSSACIILPWDLYEWYGDIEAVRKAYPMMKRYLSYLETMAKDNILSHGLGDWYDLGPNHPGVAQLTPISVTATSIYFYDAMLVSKMASLIGEKEDAANYSALAEEIKRSFNSTFLDPVLKVYSTGSQTAYSMPLFFGMVDDSIKPYVIGNLVKSINENNKALTAGDVGYRYLLRALEQEGQSQLIYEMNSKTDVPGYGFQLSKGATSLTESWAGLVNVSNNHMMLGHLMEWFYSGLAGIQQAADSKGYRHILINPGAVGDISWVDAAYRSINGEITCKWRRDNGNFHLDVTIPANTMATIVFPNADPGKILEGETAIRASASITNIHADGDKTFFDIPSGKYNLRSVTDE